MRRAFSALVVACALLFGSLAGCPRALAHAFRPATLGLREIAPGRFLVRWVPVATSAGALVEMSPSFPEPCRLEGNVLDCGARGLAGALGVPGLRETTYAVSVQIEWLGGGRTLRMLGGDAPAMMVYGAPGRGAASLAPLARDYTRLGIEHILTGVDHVLFVVGLVLLVRYGRRLVTAVTMFTVAHSLTLAAAALGAVRLPQPPVEAAIALSILLVAVECLRPAESLARRSPWIVAFSFGLLHGFGFAGALAEIGLPANRAPLALLFFNAGVELGQLAVIGTAYALAWVARRALASTRVAERWVVYALGTAAAYWSIERTAALLQS